MPAKTINLLIHTDFDKTFLGKFLRWSLTYGRYIIICTEIIVLLAFIYRFSLDRKITDLNDEIEQKSAIIAANSNFEEQFRNLQFRTEQITQLASGQNTAITILHHLEQITPPGIILKTFSLKNNVLTITATVDTNTTLASYITTLKESALLSDISVSKLTKQITDVGKTSFELVTTVQEKNSKVTSSSTPL